MSQAVNTKTGELLDVTAFMAAMRDLDFHIAMADRTIGELKENLKTARKHREGLVAELRAAARGDRALPFEPPTSDPQKGTA